MEIILIDSFCKANSFFRVRDHRDHQMRNAVVIGKLDHLRVDHDELDFVGPRLEQDTGNQRIDADRFARTRRARNQKMRHSSEVGKNRLPADVDAETDGQRGFRFHEAFVFEDVAQRHALQFLVWHFDADGRFARHRLDAHGKRRQRQREIVGKVLDFRDFDARRGLQLVARDGGAVASVDDVRLDTEIFQRRTLDTSQRLRSPLNEAAS